MKGARSFSKLWHCGAVILMFGVAANVWAQHKLGEVNITPKVFETAKGERIEAEFGQLTVPENRTKPGSRLIQLAFVRFKSTVANPGPPIVYLAGGPGGSGIGAARGTRFPLFQAMLKVADVIALDQRGVGLSSPNLVCTETVDFGPDQIPDPAAILEQYRSSSRACADRFTRQGVDLSGYNTNESADDLEDLRRAIGAEKISLWAISYGTHLALATLRRHGNRIDRVILAGIEGPSHTIKLPGSIQAHLEHIDRLVKADPGLSRVIPSFTALVNGVLDQLERAPVGVEVTEPKTNRKIKVTVNKFSVQLLTTFTFGSAEASLPAIYYRMSKGDFSFAAQQWLAFFGARQGVGSAMAYMMDCASGISPVRLRQVEKEAKTSLLGDVMNFPFMGVCPAWGASDLGESFRAPVKTNVPALFISGTFDVRTPPGNAEEVRRGFTNSVHLIIDGAVHSDPLFLSSPKIKDVILEFMKGQKVSTTKIALEPLKFDQIDVKGSN
ncbi:MAG: alpha/beta hydrolase [Pyrinomonadaceae bacterium]